MTDDLSYLDGDSAPESTCRYFQPRLGNVECPACESPGAVSTVKRIAWTNDGYTIWLTCDQCGAEGCAKLMVEAVEIEWESPDTGNDSGEWDTAADDDAPTDDDETVECSACGAVVGIEHVSDDGECPDCCEEAAPDTDDDDNPADTCDHPADAVEDGICGLCWTELSEAELTERGITVDDDTDADEE